MARNFAAFADFRALLDFHEGSDFGFVSDFASIQIGECVEADIFSQLHAGRHFGLEW
jgi:hypothetical protein